jgi:hypothetical protein
MQGSLPARLHGDREHGYERAVAQFIPKGSAHTSYADYCNIPQLTWFSTAEARPRTGLGGRHGWRPSRRLF